MASRNTQRRKAKERFAVANRLEREYLFQLKELARHIDHLVKISVHGNMSSEELQRASERLKILLQQYSNTIQPWATQVSKKIVSRIISVDETAWIQMGKEIGRELRKEMADAPTGELFNSFMKTQVNLIQSIPLEAAERVHKMTLEGLSSGERAESIAERILLTGKVTKSRATLIARTEVARTASALTMARSKHLGVTHYYWRTSADATVRESHKKMNGRIFEFSDPPEVEPGKRYAPGMFPNCRCWIEPIIDED